MAHAGELPEYVSDDSEDETSTKPVVGGGHARVGGASATFADFCLKPQITKAITAAGFEQPSKIQEEAIPEAHAGNDIIAQAKSGMGKTAVFVLVTLDRYDPTENPGQVYCVVVEPTKELVQQVVLEYKRFSPFMDGGISVMSITGGESIKEQSEKLKSSPPAIIVATPGRLSDLVDKGAIDLSKIKFFVIDEVDKVLEKADMRQNVQQIFFKTPKNKQTLCLSATLAPDMLKIVKKFVKASHKEILLESDKLTLVGLKQYKCELTEKEKNRKLVDILDFLDFNQVVVFVSTKDRARALTVLLNESKFPCIELSGRLSTHDRTEAYNKFKTNQVKILVTTDVCARGVDVAKVNIVINYDFPSSHEDKDPSASAAATPQDPVSIAADTYLHRVGRAGRFGNRGLAVSFLSSELDRKVFDCVQARFKTKIEELPEEIDTSSYMPTAGVAGGSEFLG